MAFMMSLQATLWRSVIIPEMIVCRHPEIMESATCLLTEWTLKAGGHFKADSVSLIEKGACAVLEDIALQLERKFKHAPKSVAIAFADVWKQTLVIRTLLCP